MLLTTNISHCDAVKEKKKSDTVSHFMESQPLTSRLSFLLKHANALVISLALHNGRQGMKLPV